MDSHVRPSAHLTPHPGPEDPNDGPTPRHGYSYFYLSTQGLMYFVAGMVSPSSHTNIVETTTLAGAWASLPGYPGGAVNQSAGCAIGPDQAVMGGGYLASQDPNADFYLFTGTGAVWTQQPSMPHPRAGHAMFCHAGKVFVAGGLISNASLLSVPQIDIYDVATQTWSTSPVTLPPDQVRTYSGHAQSSHYGYLVGGYSYVESPTGMRDQITRLDLDQL